MEGKFQDQVESAAEKIGQQREAEERQLQQSILERQELIARTQEAARALVPLLFEARDLLLQYDMPAPQPALAEDPATRSVPNQANPIAKFFVKSAKEANVEVTGLFGKRTKKAYEYNYTLTHWGVRPAVETGPLKPWDSTHVNPGSAVLWLPAQGKSAEVVLDNSDLDTPEGTRITIDELNQRGLLDWVARRSTGGAYASIYSARFQLRADVFLQGCLDHLAQHLGGLIAETRRTGKE